MAARPEIRERRFQVQAADHEHSARWLAMLPEVDAQAGYSHLDGQPFSPTNAAFVGVKVQWPVWEWEASYYAQRAAAEQTRAAEHELKSQRSQVDVEVASDLAQAQAASSAVEVAQETIASAEEAYRVTGALLKAGSATTTDLLDAHAALTQAGLSLTRAQYEQAVAQSNLIWRARWGGDCIPTRMPRVAPLNLVTSKLALGPNPSPIRDSARRPSPPHASPGRAPAPRCAVRGPSAR